MICLCSLEHADQSSLQLLFDAFSKFIKLLGLKQIWIRVIFMLLGNLMMKRLLCSRLLICLLVSSYLDAWECLLQLGNCFYAECKPLIEKIVSRVRSWAVKKLSYAAKVQLVNVVLNRFQLYWCQIFVLPEKVIKEIQSICRVFLWTG